MTIVLRKTPQGWTIKFRDGGDMPQNVEMPLPFTSRAPFEMVAAELRSRFPLAEFHLANG